MDTVMELIEFEGKYETDLSMLFVFKELVELSFPEAKFIYVQGPDHFFSHKQKENVFGRYRKADFGDNSRAQFTLKEKHSKSNNIKRTETNWEVGNTPLHEVEKGAEIMGLVKDATIYKYCHIYKLPEVTLVFYTVRTEQGRFDHFIEIEVEESLKITEEQALEILVKYEKVLAPLGVSAKNRLKLSLYERYRHGR